MVEGRAARRDRIGDGSVASAAALARLEIPPERRAALADFLTPVLALLDRLDDLDSRLRGVSPYVDFREEWD